MESDEEWHSEGFALPKNPFPRKNKCQFCAAYFIDEVSCAFHTGKCVARLSAFLASDGRIKFACMVCRDVFNGPAELDDHEQLHKYPGGFGCTICNDTFLNETDRTRHTEDIHKIYECHRCENGMLIPTEEAYIGHCEREHNGESGYATCLECGASFEGKSHLRFHSETECGYFRGCTCIHCAAIFMTEDALTEHMESHPSNGIKCKLEYDRVPQLEFASTETTTNLHETIENEQFYDPMDIDRSQYSDDDLPLSERLKIVKVEVFDRDNGETAEDEEKQNDSAEGSESEDTNQRNTADDDEDYTVTRKRKRSQKRLPQASFQCNFCGLTYGRRHHLQYHLRAHHLHQVEKNEGGQNENECEICGNCYSTRKHLEQHVVKFHEKFKCDKCGLELRRKMHLYQHSASDCGRKPLVNTCILCKKSFDTAKDLIAHRITHTANDMLCSTCGKQFETFNQLRAHMIVHKPIEEWVECPYCHKKFMRETSLRSHMTKHTGIKPFQCQICGERFLSLTKLQTHKKVRPKTCKLVRKQDKKSAETGQQTPVSDDGDMSTASIKFETTNRDRMNDLEFVCAICDQKYAFKRHLEKHIPLHGPDGKLVHKCECCPKFFASVDEKDQHKNENHLDEVTCPQCKKVCLTRATLRNHIKCMHLKQKSERRYTCIKCGLSFISKEFLENHEKSDCGRNPIFKCDECGKCLTNKYTYRAHLTLHQDDSESKKFICTYCGKPWRNKSQLRCHMRFHTNVRPYKCGYCEKSFCDATSKRTHESIHTGIKPYMCQCGDRFSCISNLQSHRRARKTTCGLLPLISKPFPQMITEHLDSTKK